MSLIFHLADSSDTERLGRNLALTLPGPVVVYLRGELGAGKSTLARALLRALGVQGPIKSPTYSLIEQYCLPRPGSCDQAVHLDLYRISARNELDFLALDALAVANALWLVEWPERGGDALPAADIEVSLELDGVGRRAELQGNSEIGRAWLVELGESVLNQIREK